MKRIGWAVLFAALCVAAAVLWWRYRSHARPANALEHGPPPAIPASGEELRVVRPDSSLPETGYTPPAKHADYPARFRTATDYLEFARSLLGEARAGDHAAQFYIFRALEFCRSEYRLYFDRQHSRYSLDDALKNAAIAGWPFDSEAVRQTYARCHAVMEAGTATLGERGEWLRMASAGGYPLAQVIDVQMRSRELAEADNADPEARKELRRQLGIALRSRDPEVIWEIGNTLGALAAESGGNSIDSPAWNLAACQRGFDCSPRSDGVRYACMWDRACQPYESVADVLRRGNENEFPEIEARARWINEKIDAGDWEALGF